MRPVKNEWWGADMVMCLGQGADIFAYGPADTTATRCLLLWEIQIGFRFTFLVPAHPGRPDKIQSAVNGCSCSSAFRLPGHRNCYQPSFNANPRLLYIKTTQKCTLHFSAVHIDAYCMMVLDNKQSSALQTHFE